MALYMRCKLQWSNRFKAYAKEISTPPLLLWSFTVLTPLSLD